MAMTLTTPTTNGWLDHGPGTRAGAAVCAALPTGLLAGALWQEAGPGPAAALALAFLAFAALLLLTVRRLAAA
jgi:hypothetical protein